MVFALASKATILFCTILISSHLVCSKRKRESHVFLFAVGAIINLSINEKQVILAYNQNAARDLSCITG